MEKKIIDLGIIPELEVSGVKKISLVEEPAIELDFLYFKKENFVTPSAGESDDEFISRCIPYVINEGKDEDQAAAICYSYLEMGKEKFESYNDYPESAKNAAKRALEWRDAHPDQGCGTAVGWTRANQLAKGENISEETIARMASFARHLQYKDVAYSEGCGGLMVDAWGGQAGIEWASNKLREIRGEDFAANMPHYTKDGTLWIGPTHKDASGRLMTGAVHTADSEYLYHEDDVDMVNGIIDILLQVKDIENRKRIAIKIIKDFAEQGVMYDLVDFIARIGLDTIDFEIDTTGLTPYVDQVGPKKKIEDLMTPAQLETILEMASVLGIHESEVDCVSAFNFALNPKDAEYTPARTITKEDGEEVLYKYRSSNVASNSRQFCSRMMGLSRYYSREEIDALDTFNEEFGPGVGGGRYSIFKYKGGVNCQHYWQKFIAKRVGKRLVVTEAVPTDNIQQVAETAPRTTQGRGYVKRPERNLPPLAGHSAFSKLSFNFADEEQKIVVGPAMLPNISIPRKDEETGDIYYVKFSEETIKEIAMKYMKEARTNETNTDHEVNQAGAYVFESWLVEDPKTDKANTVYGYDVPKGTWMVKMKVDDKATWKRIKNGELKGFSVEGSFSDMEEIEARRRYEKILNILK